MMTLPDGSIVYHQNEKPPKLLPGFSIDPRDPKHFIPDFPDCRHRCLQQYIKPCKKIGTRHWCNLKKRVVNVPYCNDCEEIEE